MDAIDTIDDRACVPDTAPGPWPTSTAVVALIVSSASNTPAAQALWNGSRPSALLLNTAARTFMPCMSHASGMLVLVPAFVVSQFTPDSLLVRSFVRMMPRRPTIALYTRELTVRLPMELDGVPTTGIAWYEVAVVNRLNTDTAL
ncbi:hypothetical protein HYPSUDRAFT_204676 [Hypholoma sublateritium FD-334 SS-4]|uniref:Uncharacterized protein n=1 Tax=Hypholoma sublateritium (strain FD-334 SS-4) TaxID=945553 RepID=A0A0D2KXL9_HYPSF|nr:hypothetical protein HYPSUDRAFT_204676 [Hypholoma sublateritium FD-334 SS-4]